VRSVPYRSDVFRWGVRTKVPFLDMAVVAGAESAIAPINHSPLDATLRNRQSVGLVSIDNQRPVRRFQSRSTTTRLAMATPPRTTT